MASHTVFMVMPFNDEVADSAYQSCIKPLCKEFDLSIRRADELFTANIVYDDIVREIEQATIVICDISGRNPNVFYELGISHTLKKDSTIILTHDKLKETPFDIQHFRIFGYEDSIKGTQHLKDQLGKSLQFLLNDYPVIYAKEFELAFKIMRASNGSAELISLVGLQQVNELPAHGSFETEGEIDGALSSNMSVAVEFSLSTSLALQYAQVTNHRIALTDVGKAFVAFLKANNVKCHFLNGQTLTAGYVRFRDKPRIGSGG